MVPDNGTATRLALVESLMYEPTDIIVKGRHLSILEMDVETR
jgi:hypothetical protein